METGNFIAFNFALIVALVSPGPAFIISVQTTLSSGTKSGIWFGLGLGLMAAIWTGMALLGLETIFHLFPWAYGVIRTFGAVYLIYLAIKMWLGSGDALKEVVADHKKKYSFAKGVAVNALNPKSFLFAAAILALIFPPDMALVENLLVVLNQFVVEVVFYALLACFMGREVARSSYIKLKKKIDRISSVVLGGFGLRLLVERYSNQ